MFVHTFVVGAHAGHFFVFDQELGAREASEESDSRSLDFLAQPLRETVYGDHVVAMIAHGRRGNRRLDFAGFGEEVDRFLADWRLDWRLLLPPWQELVHRARVEQRTAQAVLSDLARLFEQVDILFADRSVRMSLVMGIDQLGKAKGAGHTGGTSAHDHNIGVHLRAFNARNRFAKNDHVRSPSEGTGESISRAERAATFHRPA